MATTGRILRYKRGAIGTKCRVNHLSDEIAHLPANLELGIMKYLFCWSTHFFLKLPDSTDCKVYEILLWIIGDYI